MDLASAREIRVLDLNDIKLKELQAINKGYDKRVIKEGTYPKQDKDIQTIGTWTHLIMRCSTPEDLAYKITKSLAQNTETLGNVVAAVKGLTAKELAIDVGVPYHPGPRQFFRRGAPISLPRAHRSAGTLDAHGNRSEPPIELRIRRVVPHQVVRRQVVDDPAQRAIDVVGVDDGRAIGVGGERT